MYKQSVQHNLLYYMFKEATCFGVQDAILTPYIVSGPTMYHIARLNGFPFEYIIK
jgi:hypothetical protein